MLSHSGFYCIIWRWQWCQLELEDVQRRSSQIPAIYKPTLRCPSYLNQQYQSTEGNSVHIQDTKSYKLSNYNK